MIKIEGSQVHIDGVAVGCVEDAIANYPESADEIRALLVTPPLDLPPAENETA